LGRVRKVGAQTYLSDSYTKVKGSESSVFHFLTFGSIICVDINFWKCLKGIFWNYLLAGCGNE